ncbi:hypothetical protein [Nesterenkonia populi]|uniref:hypothetical protein n=1 Tax=Nesterenkonia populi TaxID=1591087 RepID=UPI001B869E99|nr:hypothetical protein [Nesterenkonia populi]
MTTTPNGDNAPENESGRQGSDEDRPQPRYGAYAPRQETPQGGQPEGQQQPAGPYGQPTWGQPGGTEQPASAPQQPNPYGSPSGQPPQESSYHTGYQPSPYGQPPEAHHPQGEQGFAPAAPAEKPKRPVALLVAMLAMLGAGALSLGWGIYSFVLLNSMELQEVMGEAQYQQFLDQMDEQWEAQAAGNPELEGTDPEEFLDLYMTIFGGMALVWGLFLLAMYVLWGLLGTMVNNACRIIATIWCGLSVFMLFLGFFAPLALAMTAGVVGLSILAIVMMFLPPSNEFFRQRRRWKDGQRAQPVR